MNQIQNVREMPTEEKTLARKVWENLQLATLLLSVAGQIIVGQSFLAGQIAWFIANLIAVIRNFILARPLADKIKDSCLLGITFALIFNYFLGLFW